MHEEKVRAECRRLVVRLLGEQASADALREAEVIADERAGPSLPADTGGVDDEDAQTFRSTVDRRGEAGRAGSHDEQLERELVERLWRSGGCGNLRIRGIAQDSTVGEGHQRQLRVASRLREQLAALVGIREAERMGSGAVLEHGPQLVGPSRPLLTNYVHGVRDEPSLTG